MPRFVRNFWIDAVVYDGPSKVRKWASGPRVRDRGDAEVKILARDRGDVRKVLTVEMIESEGQTRVRVVEADAGEVVYEKVFRADPDPKPRLADEEDEIGAWI